MKSIKATVAVRVEIDKELHKCIRVQALQDGVSLQQIVSSALRGYLAQRSRSAKKLQCAKK